MFPSNLNPIPQFLVKVFIFAVRVAIFSIFVGLYLCFVTHLVESSPDPECKRLLQVNEFLNEFQLTLLAMVVALAAYIGNVEQKLREKMSGRPNDEKRPHVWDLWWLETADFWLVTTGILTVSRLVAFTVKPENSWDQHLAWWGHAIIGGVAASVLYIGILHLYQWVRHRRSTAASGGQGMHTLQGAVTMLDVLASYANKQSGAQAIEAKVLSQFSAIVAAAKDNGVPVQNASQILGVASDFFKDRGSHP